MPYYLHEARLTIIILPRHRSSSSSHYERFTRVPATSFTVHYIACKYTHHLFVRELITLIESTVGTNYALQHTRQSPLMLSSYFGSDIAGAKSLEFIVYVHDILVRLHPLPCSL